MTELLREKGRWLLMGEWKEYRFEELFSIPLRNGLTKPSRIRGNGIPMVNMKEIFAFDILNDQTPMELVPVSKKEKNTLLEYNDLLFARQSLVGGGSNPLIRIFFSVILFRHYETVYRNRMPVLRSRRPCEKRAERKRDTALPL
ncbi:MAG: hypothetical protein GY820_08180 [Gammaproteobacteria bacterium]|nr:hypothetical protein [Gammaproteobacteria bacterium]